MHLEYNKFYYWINVEDLNFLIQSFSAFCAVLCLLDVTVPLFVKNSLTDGSVKVHLKQKANPFNVIPT